MSAVQNDKPSPERLAELMRAAGLPLSKRQLEQLWAFHRHLRQRNEELNMTRIFEFEAMVVKLYIDSAIVGKLTSLPSPLLDIGTGPGFPGIPLAIMHPDVQFLLSEGRHKRNAFLGEVVAMLGLKNVEVLGHRIAPDFERPVQGVITRAVETIDQTLERVLRCLQPDGRVIFMKGPECSEEMAAAAKRYGRFYELCEDIRYRLLDTPNERRLVIYRRTSLPAPAKAKGEVLRSADNSRFKLWRSLSNARTVRKEGLARVSGKASLEVLRLEPDAIRIVLVREGAQVPPEAIGLDTAVLANELFELLEPADPRLPVLLVGTSEAAPLTPEQLESLPSRCVLLALQDPREVGGAIRSAVALGVTEIGLTKEAANPFHPEALKAAGAAVLQAHYHGLPAAGELPPLTGGVFLAGPAAEQSTSGEKMRVLLGANSPAGWRSVGTPGDLPLDAGTLLAAFLSKTC
jgi:16S rRNA (guanine527-N7)-methyltransferase